MTGTKSSLITRAKEGGKRNALLKLLPVRAHDFLKNRCATLYTLVLSKNDNQYEKKVEVIGYMWPFFIGVQKVYMLTPYKSKQTEDGEKMTGCILPTFPHSPKYLSSFSTTWLACLELTAITVAHRDLKAPSPTPLPPSLYNFCSTTKEKK